MNKQAYFKLMGLEKIAKTMTISGQKSWDPAVKQLNQNNDFWDVNKIDNIIEQELKKYYARQLARAYKRATGKNLADPAKYIKPRFNYILGGASGAKQSILKELNWQDAKNLNSWISDQKQDTLDPGLIADAVNSYNRGQGRYNSLKYGKPLQGPKLDLIARD